MTKYTFKEENHKIFDELKMGECFYTTDLTGKEKFLYVKINHIDTYNAICVSMGTLQNFSPTEVVTVVKEVIFR